MCRTAHDDELSKLQIAKLNAAIRIGWPLQRWLHTVIALLQKEMGTIMVNKLRAICLFEADFNYVLKVIFAQRMMSKLNQRNLLPAEHHAKVCSGAKNATMNRMLYQDVHRTLHWPYATALVDLGDCYDSMYHDWNAISLLAAGVPDWTLRAGVLRMDRHPSSASSGLWRLPCPISVVRRQALHLRR